MAAKKRKPYHHGDLKQTLLDAAVESIADSGPQGFTLREVARRAGVSHNAPYRHFQDKDDLMGAVAAEGFDLLTAAMIQAMKAGTTAAARLKLAGRGYVEFALGSPQHIVIMFETPGARDCRPEYTEAGLRAFQVLLDAVVATQQEGGLPQGDPQPFAVAAWAAVHGLAKLSIGGRLPLDAGETLGFTDYLSTVVVEGVKSTASRKPAP